MGNTKKWTLTKVKKDKKKRLNANMTKCASTQKRGIDQITQSLKMKYWKHTSFGYTTNLKAKFTWSSWVIWFSSNLGKSCYNWHTPAKIGVFGH